MGLFRVVLYILLFVYRILFGKVMFLFFGNIAETAGTLIQSL